MAETKNDITEVEVWSYKSEPIRSLEIDVLDQFISNLLRDAQFIPRQKLQQLFLENCGSELSDKDEHEKLDALEKAIQENGYKLIENLKREKEILLNRTIPADGYSRFHHKIAKEKTKIASLPTIEVKNALRYYWNQDDNPVDIINKAVGELGYSDYSEVKKRINEIYEEVNEDLRKQPREEETLSTFGKSKGKQSKSSSGFLFDDDRKQSKSSSGFLFDDDRKQSKVIRIAPYYRLVDSTDDDKKLYFTPSEWNYPHVAIDFFHMPSLIILDDIIEIMEKDENIILEPTDGGNLRTCTSGAVYVGRISFSVKSGDPIKIFKDIVDVINQKYGIGAEFTKWRPFVDHGFIQEECVDYMLGE